MKKQKNNFSQFYCIAFEGFNLKHWKSQVFPADIQNCNLVPKTSQFQRIQKEFEIFEAKKSFQVRITNFVFQIIFFSILKRTLLFKISKEVFFSVETTTSYGWFTTNTETAIFNILKRSCALITIITILVKYITSLWYVNI